MAFEVILMVWLPGLAAHIAEALAAQTSHEVASGRSLHSLVTPGADLGVQGHPFGISLFLEHHVQPLGPFFTRAWAVVIIFAAETKVLAAITLDCRHIVVFALDAVGAIGPRAALVGGVGSAEELAQKLLVFFDILPVEGISLENVLDDLVDEGNLAAHALGEGVERVDALYYVAVPAVLAKALMAQVHQQLSLLTANVAAANARHYHFGVSGVQQI